MGKRAAPDEQPYRPLLDVALVSAAIAQGSQAGSRNVEARQTVTHRLLELPSGNSPATVNFREAASSGVASKLSDRNAQRLPAQHVVEKFDHEKRILFTKPETQDIDRLVTSLAHRLGAQIKVSHVFRALVALLLNAEGDIDKRAGEVGALIRPPNGDALALQRFERELARIIGAAIRDAGPIR